MMSSQKIQSADGSKHSHGLTTKEIDSLRTNALQVKSNAYCPYSNFNVGCALLLKSGELIMGANVECASFAICICAERAAFGSAISSGCKPGSFKAVAVATNLDDFCTPCGMCRQLIREFCHDSTPVILFNRSGQYDVETVGTLLPRSFGPDDLKKNHPAPIPEATGKPRFLGLD